MRFLKPIFAAVALLAALGVAGPAAAQRGRQAATVMIVDYQRIVASSDVGRDMTTKLNQINQQMQAELQPEAQAIQQEQQSIQQASANLSETQLRNNSALNQRAQAFTQRYEQFRVRNATMERDFNYTRAVTLNRFGEQIGPILREVMDARGAGVVVDASSVLLQGNGFDATDDVVQRLNQRVRTIEVTRQAAPQQQQQQ